MLRVAVTGIIGLLLVGAGLAGPTSSRASQSWIQSYHDAGHTGYNPKESTVSRSNVSQLQLLWGSSALTDTVAGMAVDGGVVYAESFASTANLAAIETSTGATLWTATPGNTGFSYFSPIAVGDGLVFAQCSFNDQGGTSYGAVCAYKKTTGKLKWQWSSPCNCQPESGLNSPMVFADDAIYFGYSNGGAGGAEYFVALDAKSGTVLWTYGTGGPNTAGYATVAVSNGLVYVGCNGNNFQGVCALNQTSGAPVWSANIGTNSLAFTVSNSTLIVNANLIYEAIALDASTGAMLWTYTTDGNDEPVAVAKNVAYGHGSGGELFALDASTGTQLWATSAQNLSSSPSVAHGIVYVAQSGSNWPAASAYNAKNGALLWSSPGGAGYGYVPPVVANGTLFIANGPCGFVCAYGLTTAHR